VKVYVLCRDVLWELGARTEVVSVALTTTAALDEMKAAMDKMVTELGATVEIGEDTCPVDLAGYRDLQLHYDERVVWVNDDGRVCVCYFREMSVVDALKPCGNHTPTPWEVNKGGAFNRERWGCIERNWFEEEDDEWNSITIAELCGGEGDKPGLPDIGQRDAERIVACVNACEGVDDPMAVIPALLAERRKEKEGD
jgi:hypothetical protein